MALRRLACQFGLRAQAPAAVADWAASFSRAFATGAPYYKAH